MGNHLTYGFNQELCTKRYGKKLAITPLKCNAFFYIYILYRETQEKTQHKNYINHNMLLKRLILLSGRGKNDSTNWLHV